MKVAGHRYRRMVQTRRSGQPKDGAWCRHARRRPCPIATTPHIGQPANGQAGPDMDLDPDKEMADGIANGEQAHAVGAEQRISTRTPAPAREGAWDIPGSHLKLTDSSCDSRRRRPFSLTATTGASGAPASSPEARGFRNFTDCRMLKLLSAGGHHQYRQEPPDHALNAKSPESCMGSSLVQEGSATGTSGRQLPNAKAAAPRHRQCRLICLAERA